MSYSEKMAAGLMPVQGFDRLLTAQRPAVLAHIRNIRRRHPDATPGEVIRILEQHFHATVTAGGATAGAAAIVPGVGTTISLAITGVETAIFLESCALLAQAVSEIHGIAVTDPDRARTIVMAMVLGKSGGDLVRNLAAQASGTGVSRNTFWGDLIGRNLPQAVVGPIATRVRRSFMRRFTRNTATSAIGRIIPFGIGAVVGGVGSNVLGRKIIESSRIAFGPPPVEFPANLDPRPRKQRTIRLKVVSGGKSRLGPTMLPEEPSAATAATPEPQTTPESAPTPGSPTEPPR